MDDATAARLGRQHGVSTGEIHAIADDLAADASAIWGAGLLALAADYDAAVPRGASAVTAAELREAAAAPPDCEAAFRFQLCLLLDIHPRRNRADLDAAVARARNATR